MVICRTVLHTYGMAIYRTVLRIIITIIICKKNEQRRPITKFILNIAHSLAYKKNVITALDKNSLRKINIQYEYQTAVTDIEREDKLIDNKLID